MLPEPWELSLEPPEPPLPPMFGQSAELWDPRGPLGVPGVVGSVGLAGVVCCGVVDGVGSPDWANATEPPYIAAIAIGAAPSKRRRLGRIMSTSGVE